MGFLTSPGSIMKSVLQTTAARIPVRALRHHLGRVPLQSSGSSWFACCTALLWSVGIHEIGFIEASLCFSGHWRLLGGKPESRSSYSCKNGCRALECEGPKDSCLFNCNSSIDLMKSSMSEQLLVKLDCICPVTRTLLSLRPELPSRGNVAGVARLSPCPRGALALCEILWLPAPRARSADVGLRVRVLRVPARILEGRGRRARVSAAVLAPAPSPAPGDSLAGGIASFSLGCEALEPLGWMLPGGAPVAVPAGPLRRAPGPPQCAERRAERPRPGPAGAARRRPRPGSIRPRGPGRTQRRAGGAVRTGSAMAGAWAWARAARSCLCLLLLAVPGQPGRAGE